MKIQDREQDREQRFKTGGQDGKTGNEDSRSGWEY